MPTFALTEETIDSLAAVALANVGAEYPFHLQHLASADTDLLPPRALHPAFYGSYDWHSCVHMHWTLVRSLRLRPAMHASAAIASHLDARLSRPAIDGECAYFNAPGRASFERPYGWGWALLLQAELDALAAALPPAKRWREAMAPLATLLADRMRSWLPRAEYPLRAGSHGNSAFALLLAQRYAQRFEDLALAAAIAERARRWFGSDRNYPAGYEPSGDDFVSPGLCEALLLARTLDADSWRRWWEAFAPELPANWLVPVQVTDAGDAKIVHLHGLNLSRAWCWRQLLPLLPEPLQAPVRQAVDLHLHASLAAATSGDYVGTHWLASFALLALAGDCSSGS